MVELGFVGDAAGAKKVVDLATKTEDAITKATEGGATDRVLAEKQASAERIGIIGALAKIFVSMEEDRTKREAKIRLDAANRDEKLQQERENKARERRAAALKEIQIQATRMASFALKAVGAIEATALGIVYATDRAAKGFERLNYASQRAGTTAGRMNAYEFASRQLGGQEGAGARFISSIGEKLKDNEAGYASILRPLGVAVRNKDGSARDREQIALDIGEALAKKAKNGGQYGYATAKRYGETLGLDGDEFQTAIDPRMRAMEAERQAIDAKTGADPAAAAEGGTKFEQSMRRLEAMADSIRTKISTSLFVTLTPELDKLGKWVEEHGDQIVKTVDQIVTALIRFAEDGLKKLAGADWDAVLQDIGVLANKFVAIANALETTTSRFIAFGAAIEDKVVGPIKALLGFLGKIDQATSLNLGGVFSDLKAIGNADQATSTDPTGAARDLGAVDQATSTKGGVWSWMKSKLGFGSDDPDSHRVKDAILQTADSVKKLADAGGMGGGSVNAGGGASIGRGAPNLRYGRKGSGGGYNGTPVPDAPYNGKNIDGLTEAQSKQYASILGNRESGNRYGSTNPGGYAGRWQFGASALAENGYVRPGTTNAGLKNPGNWLGKNGASSLGDWLGNKGGVQDQALGEYTNRHYAQLKAAGVIRDGMSPSEIAGWLAAAHLKGVGGAIALSKGHDNADGNGTFASSYRRMMAGVGSGAAPASTSSPSAATPAAPAAAPTSSGPTEADYIAALRRTNDGWKLKPASQARLDQDKADQATMDAFAKTHPDAWKLADKALPKSGMGLDHVEPGPEVRGRARTMVDPGDKPVKVEVTDDSAVKIGKAGASREKLLADKAASEKRMVGLNAAKAEAHAHLAATQAVLRTHRGQMMGVDPHSSLGRSIRHSIDMSRRHVAMTNAPVFNIHGVTDTGAAMADAHRTAGRGQADLVRNMSVMTA